jgi:hypothetical protein
VPGAINIPGTSCDSRLAELEHARDRLVVYCERGPCAAAAMAIAGCAPASRVSGIWRRHGGLARRRPPIEKRMSRRSERAIRNAERPARSDT